MYRFMAYTVLAVPQYASLLTYFLEHFHPLDGSPNSIVTPLKGLA